MNMLNKENQNALAKAKSYYKNMNMSKSAVYDQLISYYGQYEANGHYYVPVVLPEHSS